jgi:citrate synthase
VKWSNHIPVAAAELPPVKEDKMTKPPEKKMGAGLRGVTAGETRLCTVGKTGTGLTYLGYDIS